MDITEFRESNKEIDVQICFHVFLPSFLAFTVASISFALSVFARVLYKSWCMLVFKTVNMIWQRFTSGYDNLTSLRLSSGYRSVSKPKDGYRRQGIFLFYLPTVRQPYETNVLPWVKTLIYKIIKQDCISVHLLPTDNFFFCKTILQNK